jgi:hypothetical protein
MSVAKNVTLDVCHQRFEAVGCLCRSLFFDEFVGPVEMNERQADPPVFRVITGIGKRISQADRNNRREIEVFGEGFERQEGILRHGRRPQK